MTIHSVVIQKLLSTNAHLGRRVAAHHFKIYTYGSRNAMTIIDSDKTLICLRNACQFIANLVRQKGRFLFVNTNTLFDEIVYQMTQKIGCASDTSWRLGGFLTNSGSPKKFRSRNKKLHLGSIQPPDCVVIMDTQRKSSVIFEADKLQIPIVGLVDSSMPWDIYKRITYPVPANDSVQFVYLFCNLITKTFLLEQKRFAAALGATKRDEQLSHPMTDTGDVSENIKQSKTSIGSNEIFVIPYESLGLTSDDPLETKELLDKLVVLKLNGGLGTKMGFNGPKCAIEVCNGLTYLDLIVNQIESLNSKHGCNVPLILMNTIRTHDSTLKAVEKYSKKTVDILTLCQNQSYPVNKRQDSEDEMYHFDQQRLFLSLKNSGTLDALLLQGKEYILVVKSDNLGTVVDSKILNHLVQNRIQYCMELSEIAQIPDKRSAEKLRLCDTSNLWVNLKAIKRLVETDALNMENYPVSKKVNNDEICLQEMEASSAIRFFDRAIGVTVPQSRFQPMMRTSDLLVVQSDLYTYTEGVLTRNSARTNLTDPSIELGPEFEKGKVTIVAKPGTKLEIPDGAVIENKEISDPRDI